MEKKDPTLNIQHPTLITDIPCVILAGGRSKRMGEDKSLLPFGGFDTMCEYQYKKLSKIFKDIYISTKEDKFNFKADLILDDIDKDSSPIVALRTIFKKLETKKIFIVTVDVPLLHIETIKNLIYNSKDYDIVIAKDDETIHNLCGVFDSSLLKSVETMLSKGIHKVNYLIKNTPNHCIITYNNKEQFLNLNEKATYNKANDISKSYSKY